MTFYKHATCPTPSSARVKLIALQWQLPNYLPVIRFGTAGFGVSGFKTDPVSCSCFSPHTIAESAWIEVWHRCDVKDRIDTVTLDR